MTSLAELLETAEPHTHLVQLYGEDDRALVKNVSRYLADGLRRHEGLLVIATAGHSEAFLKQLREDGAAADQAMEEGRLQLLDALTTLATFMVNGQPDWDRFERTIGGAVHQLRTRTGAAQFRGYGEMVGLLWKAGQPEAAMRLEQYWNKVLASHSLRLFCAYPIDIFGQDFQIATVDAVLCSHTHLLPSDPAVEQALQRAMDEVLGSKLEGLRALIKPNYRPSWAVVPPPEAVILWLRNNLSVLADDILARAGRYYRRSHLTLHSQSEDEPSSSITSSSSP